MENMLININSNEAKNPIALLFQIENEEPIVLLQSSHSVTINLTEGQNFELTTKDGRKFKVFVIKKEENV